MSSPKASAVVDETRVLRLLRGVTDDLATLRRESAADQARRSDPLWLSGVKYTFLTAIEGCIDIAQHFCASEGWGPPAGNGDAIALLGRHGVLRPDVVVPMRRAVGFRNVLAHDYVAVDDAIVLGRLADVSDLDHYVLEIAEFLR